MTLRLLLTRRSVVRVLRGHAAQTLQHTLSFRIPFCTGQSYRHQAVPRLRGHDQAGDWFEKEFGNVQSRIIPDRFVEEGDVVVGLGRGEVRWIESGDIAQESESAGAFWFRDGKIVRWQPFETYDAALKAAGRAV